MTRPLSALSEELERLSERVNEAQRPGVPAATEARAIDILKNALFVAWRSGELRDAIRDAQKWRDANFGYDQAAGGEEVLDRRK